MRKLIVFLSVAGVMLGTMDRAYADCAAAPLATATDMVISMKTANGVQVAPGSQLSSTVKEGMVVYDDTANELKLCDGTNWVSVGSGGGGGGGALWTFCTNEQSDGDSNGDVAACVEATANSSRGTSNYRAVNCVQSGEGGARSGNAILFDGTNWVYYLNGWNVCQDGSAIIASLNSAGGGGGATAAGAAGYLQFSDGAGSLDYSGTTAGEQLFWDSTNKRLGIGTITPSDNLHIVGNVRATSSFLAGSGSANSPAYRFSSSADTGLYRVNSGVMGFSTAAAERMRIDADGNINIGGAASAPATALLELTSTTKGFLPPRMTTAQRNAIASPATGLVVYDTDLNSLYVKTATAWAAVGAGSGSGSAVAFSVHKNGTNQTLSTGNNPITWSSELYDIGNNFASNTFTAPVTGQYLFVLYTVCTSSSSACAPTLTSSSGDSYEPSTTIKYNGYVTAIMNLTAGATVTASLNVAAGNTLSGTSGHTYFQGTLLGGGSGGGGGSTTLAALTDVDVSTPPTDGQSLVYNSTASKWEPGTVSGGGGSTIAFRGTISSGSLGAGLTNLTGFTEEYDTGNNFNPTTGVFTAPSAGQYMFTGMGHISTSTTDVYVQLKVNNVVQTYGSRAGVAGNSPMSNVAMVYNLNTNDTVQLAYTLSGATGSSLMSQFSGFKLGGGSGGSSQWTTATDDIYYNTGAVTIGGTTIADPTSLVDLRSTTKGFLPPRMTTAQRTAISSPATGLVVYDTDLNSLYIKTASAWSAVGSGGGSSAAIFYKCTNEQSDGDTTGDVAACVAATNNNGATGNYRAINCTYPAQTNINYGEVVAWAATKWTFSINSNTYDCIDGSVLVADMTATSGSGGSASAAGSTGAVQFNGGSSAFAADDTNFFWDDTNNRLGIGTAAPGTELHIASATTFKPQLTIENTTADDKAGYLVFKKSRTGASPTAGDGLGTLVWQAKDTGGTWRNTAYINGIAGTAGAAFVPATIGFTTVDTAGTGNERMRISADGNVGIGTSAPASKLHVSGDGLATTALSGVGTLGINGGSPQISFNDNDSADWAIHVNSNKLYFIREPWVSNDLVLDGTGGIGMGTTAPSASAVLDITSTTKGFLPPRMTTAQRDAIASPAEGLVVHDTTLKKMFLYSNADWMPMSVGCEAPNVQTFNTSGTWTKPTCGTTTRIQCWGGGGSGGRHSSNGAGGGGGGAHNMQDVPKDSLSATVTVTIGAGGAGVSANGQGQAGGTTTFGSYMSVYGGGGGMGSSSTASNGSPSTPCTQGGGGGGGQGSTGTTPTTGAVGGAPGGDYVPADVVVGSSTYSSPNYSHNWTVSSMSASYLGGGGGACGPSSTGDATPSVHGGGGGGGSNAGQPGGNSVFGGGGGGGSYYQAGHVGSAGGTSTYGGAGGAGGPSSGNGVAGTQPAGGGGGARSGTSGAGGDGKCIVTTY